MNDDKALFDELADHLKLPKETTRRGFLRLTFGSAVAAPICTAWAVAAPRPLVTLLRRSGARERLRDT